MARPLATNNKTLDHPDIETRYAFESPEGTSPSGAHGTGRERLRSSGSSHRSLPPQQRPVCKQLRVPARNPRQPVAGTSATSSQTFELVGCPQYQFSINLPERRIQSRLVEGTVVLDPSPDLRIEHARQIVQSLVAAQLQPPAPNFLADRLRRLGTDGRIEANKEPAVPPP